MPPDENAVVIVIFHSGASWSWVMVVGHLSPVLGQEETIAHARYVDAVRDGNCVHFAVVVLYVETECSATEDL